MRQIQPKRRAETVILAIFIFVAPPAAPAFESAAQIAGLGAEDFEKVSLDELVEAHFDAVALSELVKFLAPAGWRVRYDVSEKILSLRLVFHAEMTRRRALDELFSQFGLRGVFYPGAALILVHERERA